MVGKAVADLKSWSIRLRESLGKDEAQRFAERALPGAGDFVRDVRPWGAPPGVGGDLFTAQGDRPSGFDGMRSEGG